MFFCWLITDDDESEDQQAGCDNIADERRVLSLAQDAMHCATHGRVKLPKHVGLAMTVRHLTASKQLISILNRMGHCSSYDEIEAVDTALAIEVLAKSQQSGVVIPSNVVQGSFVQFAADNNDLNEETLDGKNTTHATTMVIFQKQVYGPHLPSEVIGDHRSKRRSLDMSIADDDILECSAHGRRPSVTAFVTQLQGGSLSPTAFDDLSTIPEFTWALSRLPPTQLFDVNDREREEQCVPGFPSTTKWQICAIVPNWPLRPQSTGFLIGLDFHTLTTPATCHMIDGCNIPDRQDNMIDHEVFTYNILFVGHFVISFGARCSSGYVCLQNECCLLVAYYYLDLYGTNA
jgi:hypothetical protein